MKRNLLKSFPYQDNRVTLHSDDSVIPRRKSARASWNAYLPRQKSNDALVTYDMNILQSLPTTEPFCVSLNQQNLVNESKVHGNFNFLTLLTMRGVNEIRQDIHLLFETRVFHFVELIGDMDSMKTE